MAPFMSFDENRKDNEIGQVDESSKKTDNVSTTVQEDAEISLDHRMDKVVNGGAMTISVPRYTTSQLGKVKVSWAIIDDVDYYYQIEFLGGQEVNDREAIGEIITRFSEIVPDHIDVYVYQPPTGIEIPLYTVIVKGGAKLLGAKDFMEKRLVEKILEMGMIGDA